MDFKRLTNGCPQEDDAYQKEIKEKSEDLEKYCSKNAFLNNAVLILFNNNKFIITNTVLNIHSFTDDILQPPKFA